jgi:hypothetical protein
MRSKHYKQERIYLKEEKRQSKNFNTSKERKRFVEDIKRSFRALKRSERQTVKKEIEKTISDDILGFEDDYSRYLDSISYFDD